MVFYKLLEKLEEDKKLCLRLKECRNPTNDTEMFFKWLLNTTQNPFNIFFSNEIANSCCSIQGLAILYDIIHHALYDDGAITFISINDCPKIIFSDRTSYNNDQEFLDAIKLENLYDSHYCKTPPVYKILDCDIKEFIRLRDQYYRKQIKRLSGI